MLGEWNVAATPWLPVSMTADRGTNVDAARHKLQANFSVSCMLNLTNVAVKELITDYRFFHSVNN